MGKYELLGSKSNGYHHSSSNGGCLPSHTVAGSPGRACWPWLTRCRLLGVLCMSLLATIFLLLQCLRPGLLHQDFLCCRESSHVAVLAPHNHTPPLTQASRASNVLHLGDEPENPLEEEYDYDEGLEGAQTMHSKHTKRRLPHCLIIGVRKGGTRALLEFLNLHPAIQAEKREMHFFDDDAKYNLGLEWYRKRMPYTFSEQLTVEKTPAYFVEEIVPERVHKMNSSIKLLLILRDPVERAISDYMQIYTTRREKGKYHENFEDLAIVSGDVNKSYKAIRRSVYHRHMEHWLQWFPLNQFHFVSGENLVKNPVEELRKVEDFLQIEHKLTQEHFFFNQTRGFYCMHMEKREKCLAPSKGRAHLPINQDVVYKLREYFRPHNQRLYEMVGINFGWP